MYVRLWVVGKGNPELLSFERSLLRRMRPYAAFEVIELAEGRGRKNEQRREQEERIILQRLPSGFILFDEGGRSLDSHQWAEHFARQSGNARLDFLIGGAAGVTEQVRRQAGMIWSLSKLTLPHQLVRILVIEQCYRAFTILAGHPYHRQ
ncbi:MAG: 23S rRNA (pseudouridine(1915)-N(3))-methyltransferase RlmH [Zetaproteobacteria bacterium]|nr:MAG: 23S rRNA (pseudouridine(1915)-N(3))-methyltransferase RlmH [Zetaproteobacteria bacterium]